MCLFPGHLIPNNKYFLYLQQINSPVIKRSLYTKDYVFIFHFSVVLHVCFEARLWELDTEIFKSNAC